MPAIPVLVVLPPNRYFERAKVEVSLIPKAEASAEFGKHLAGIFTGCYRPTFAGGPIAGGPPRWARAANLTPYAQGIAV